MKNKKNLLLNLTLAAVLSASCAKELPDDPTDHVKDNVYPASLFDQSVVVTVEGEENGILAVEADEEIQGVWALNAKKYRKVVNVEGDELLKRFFKNVELESSTPGEKIKINFNLTKGHLVAFVDKSHASSTSPHLQELSAGEEKGTPVFQYSIGSWGILEKVTNSLGEETRTVTIKETIRSQATHVSINSLDSNLEYAGIRGLSKEEQKEIFLKDSLQAKYFTVKDIKAISPKHNIFNSEKFKSFTDATLLKSFLNSETIFFHTAINKKDLDKEELRKLKQGLHNTVLKACTQKDLELLKFEGNLEDCVTKAVLSKSLTLKTQKRDQEADTKEKLATISLEDALEDAKVLLVKMSQDDELKEYSLVDLKEEFTNFDGKTLLKVSELEKKEYFYRKVLIDAPNTFEVTFAGTATDVTLVKISFEEDKMSIKRARSILGKDGETEVDEEALLSFPVKYYRLVNEINGRRLVSPKHIEATHTEEGAIAAVDFSNNMEINDLNSVLDSDLAACFVGTTETEINDLFAGKRSGKHMINFTLDTSRGVNTHRCGGESDAGAQANLKFKERVSMMEYKKDRAETTDLNIPFDAQKKLGFGFFTGMKVTGQGYSQDTDSEKSNTYLPSRFDIKNCKQVEYVLTGIPLKDGGKNNGTTDLRNRLITSTHKVINDLNEGFYKALKGTALDRANCTTDGSNKPVLTLSIERDANISGNKVKVCKDYETNGNKAGCEKIVLPVVERAVMGDLDKNYVYYMQKATSYPILGLGGAHKNPLTGEVISASVYQYGGNMKNGIEWMIESYNALKKWQKLTEETRQVIAQQATEADVAEANAEIADVEPSTSTAAETHASASESAERLINRINTERTLNRTASINLRDRRILDFKDRIAPAGEVKLSEKYKSLLEKRTANNINLYKQAMLMQDIMNAKNTPEEINKVLLKHENPIAHAKHEMIESLSWKTVNGKKVKKDICLHTRDASIVSSVISKLHDDYNIDKISKSANGFNKILIDTWRPTLAHEIGHNIGLRHNFIASYDKYNHKFNAADTSKRRYSSVMDYMLDDHVTYDGLGPYDVHAIRAGYAGLLELNPTSPIAAAAKVEVDGKKFVKINDIKKILGLDVWKNLDTKDVKKIGIKKYEFCSDLEASVGSTPMCARHDWGTSPEEIVDHVIMSMEGTYAISNIAGDSKTFSRSRGGAAAHYFGKLRSMNEEFLFQRIHNQPMFFDYAMLNEEDLSKFDDETRAFIERDKSFISAIFKSFEYLESKVRQPGVTTVTNDASSLQRFVPFVRLEDELNAEGLPTGNKVQVTKLIETKAIESINFDNEGVISNDSATSWYTDSRRKVKGSDIERVYALLFLTEKGSNSYKHSYNSLEFPYYLLSDSLTERIQKLQSEILTDSLTPAALIDGKVTELDAPFTTRTTDFLRQYAAITSALYMNVDDLGLENPGRSFRVLSTRDVNQVGQIGLQEIAGEKIYFPSADDANTAKEILVNAVALKHLIDSGVEEGIKQVVSLNQNKGKETLYATSEVGTVKEINSVIVGNPNFAGFYNTAKEEQLAQIAQIKAQILAMIGKSEVVEQPATAETEEEVSEETEVVASAETEETTEEVSYDKAALEQLKGQYNLFTIIAINKALMTSEGTIAERLERAQEEFVAPYTKTHEALFDFEMELAQVTVPVPAPVPGMPPVNAPLNMEYVNGKLQLFDFVKAIATDKLERPFVPVSQIGDTEAQLRAEIMAVIKRECVEGCDPQQAQAKALTQQMVNGFEKVKGILTTIAKANPIDAAIFANADSEIEVTNPNVRAHISSVTPNSKLSLNTGVSIGSTYKELVNNAKFLEQLYFMQTNN
ncbi:zinc-dependent metalloprotease [Halobacteriovorax sp. HLS]|uniref:zinc-dependent metalloprotease n=1 Tax=Halobacteriovorax sp. HLS TaxID=2234000 RepID=UPI000FDAB58E|nr:zinc-dependent metalloprotease [Halobacteriovorax sp. HLS]